MAESKPQDIRNIVLLGHGGSGKTTLAEAMLHLAKVTTRLGSVDDGTSQLDYSDIERERHHSVDPSLAHFEHEGQEHQPHRRPGLSRFHRGAICSIAGADTGIVVISAPAGIEVNTRKLFKAAQTAGLALAIVINKIDAENIQWSASWRTSPRRSDRPASRWTSRPRASRPSGCSAARRGATEIGDVPSPHGTDREHHRGGREADGVLPRRRAGPAGDAEGDVGKGDGRRQRGAHSLHQPKDLVGVKS